MDRHSIALSAALGLVIATPSLAGPQPNLSDALQQEALTCAGEAMQVCPDVWTSEDHGLACMTGKRSAFSPRCRLIYDKVAQALGRPSDAAPGPRLRLTRRSTGRVGL